MSQAMVCAPQPEAVEAGLNVLAHGGNVVDAAIGAALVQTVVDPQMCGVADLARCVYRATGLASQHRFPWACTAIRALTNGHHRT